MNILITDSTLRDGNHAASHTIQKSQIIQYCQFAEDVGIDIIEVGHGNGLGASSLQLGQSTLSDEEMLSSARNILHKTKLGIHIIPGFGRMTDLDLALEIGVDVFRVASHCTEANITKRHMEYLINNEKTVYGVLMMSHMADKETLLAQSKLMASYGASAIILMDSAGHYLPQDVKEKITYLREHLDIALGFHAHNNLSLAIANSIEAVLSGATLVDATIGGYGAGAGNTALEVLVPVLEKMQCDLSLNSEKILANAELIATLFSHQLPIKSDSIVSGIHGIFSGFLKPVKRASEMFHVNVFDIYKQLGAKKVIAGQEDLIIEIARGLSDEQK